LYFCTFVFSCFYTFYLLLRWHNPEKNSQNNTTCYYNENQKLSQGSRTTKAITTKKKIQTFNRFIYNSFNKYTNTTLFLTPNS
jgi:hypothetical protein